MKKNALIYCVVATALLICSCNNTTRTVRIKVGYLPMVSSLTHFVAMDKGYYKEQGFEVEANPIKTSNLIAQDLAAGHIDAGIELSLVPLLTQLDKSPNSIKIFSISNINTTNGFDGVIVKNDAPYQKLEDLAGKRIGAFPGTTGKTSLLDIFRSRFPDSILPEIIELDPPLHLQSLSNGDIDGLFTYEPTLTTGIIMNGFRKISSSIYAMQYSPNPIGVAAVNAKWMKSNPDLARSFFTAIDKAVQFIENNPVEARRILAKATGLQNEKISNAMNIMPLSLSKKIDLGNLRGYLEILKKLGEIKTVPDPAEICITQ